MVTVRLVEKRVKRKEGMVIVVKVINQYRTPGTNWIVETIIRPKIHSHDDAGGGSVTAFAVAKANDAVVVAPMLLDKLVLVKL